MLDHDEPEQLELLHFDHIAVRPPRESHIGEMVFSEMWKEAMNAAGSIHDDCDEYAFRSVMSCFPRKLTQRHASVAATFVMWLGTSVGSGYLHEARRLEQAGGGWGRGYVAAWAVQNQRQTSINWGVRTLEFLLAPAECFNAHKYAPTSLKYLPDLSADDYEVAEHVARWLGNNEGVRFVATCERLIAHKVSFEREQRLSLLAYETGNQRLKDILKSTAPL